MEILKGKLIKRQSDLLALSEKKKELLPVCNEFNENKLDEAKKIEKLWPWKRTKEQKQLLKERDFLLKEMKKVNNSFDKVKKDIASLEKDVEKAKVKQLKQVEKEFKKNAKMTVTKCELVGENNQVYTYKVSYYDKKAKKNREAVVAKVKLNEYDEKNKRKKSLLLHQGEEMAKFNNQKGIIQPLASTDSFLAIQVAGDKNLKDFLKTEKVEEDMIPRIMNDLYSGLNNIHTDGLLHNDLTLENMMIDTKTNKAKIVGLACANGAHLVPVPDDVIHGVSNARREKELTDKENLTLFNVFKKCLIASYFGPETPQSINRAEEWLENNSDKDIFSGYIRTATARELISEAEEQEIRNDFRSQEDFADSQKLEAVFNLLNTRQKNKEREKQVEISYKGAQRAKDVLRELKYQDKSRNV
ncbi:MAG: hypothetical protein Ta2D_01600 [Rickettsiales bacterium]|nr:MAG: hypothetical protein Ta2D_01600 [Rickettsiales bacterium]